MTQREKICLSFLNSKIIANSMISIIIDLIFDFTSIIKSVFGVNPDITGYTRLTYRIMYLISRNGSIKVTPSGVYKNDILLENPCLEIMEFLPSRGICFFDADDIYKVSEKIRSAVFRKDPIVAKKYYRTKALYLLVFLGFIISFLCMAFILVSPYYRVPMKRKILSSLWLIPNLYFFLQTVLFYTMRLKHISMKTGFEEACPEEIKRLSESSEQPLVIAVIPTFMEDHSLVERTVLSLCLQNYSNMEVVLLLGNDVYSKDRRVIDNTNKIKEMTIRIKREMFGQKRKIYKVLKEIKAQKSEDIEILLKKLEIMSAVFDEISAWHRMKAKEFRNLQHKYPTDDYLIRHTFIKKYRYFKRNSLICKKLYYEAQKRLNNKLLNGPNFESLILDINNTVTTYHKELSGLFKIKLKVFTRTRFVNLEQEKTKAGNLTAFTSLIGGTWRQKKLADEKYMMIPSDYGIKIEEPKYFVSFDSDTIAKPDYIIRKIAFMERESNRDIGLIQSPYVTPTPEPEIVASASGVQSYWFLPVSVGLTAFNSASWLGFNGVIRFEAIEKTKSFLTETIIEDTENSIKIKNAGYRVITSAEEQCITFSPLDLNALKVQRIRWASGGFKLAKKLIAGFKSGQSGFKTLTEKVLGLNYVLGLNTLPMAVTAIYFIASPFKYNYFYIEMLPFFLYIVSFVVLMKTLTKYKLINILDGFAVCAFMNLYHIIGTINSFKGLFSRERKKYFNSTPRNTRNHFKGIGDLEFFGILFLVTWLGMRVIDQLSNSYLDVFPMFHITLALYGVFRFRNKKENSIIEKTLAGSAIIQKRSFNMSKALRITAASLALVMVFSGPFVSYVDRWIQINYMSHETLNLLYHNNEKEYPVNAFKQCEKLGKGISLGGAFESVKEGEWGLKLTEEHFKVIKEAGFDTVRVPINWSSRTQKRSPYKIDELFFKRIDWLLLNAKKNSLNVVLDFHGYNEIYFSPKEHTERFVNIWRQIAQRYKNCDLNLYYELLNEPCEKITADIWNQLSRKTIEEIRKVDKFHTIILSGAGWACSTGLYDLEIPSVEKNVICSFHTYTPVAFTHQGIDYVPQVEFKWLRNISWPGPPKEPVKMDKRLKGFEWARTWINDYNTLKDETNPANPRYLIEELDFAYNWGKSHNRPIWLGEFGVTVNADEGSRERWAGFLTNEAQKRGMTWAYWDFGVNCRVYDLKKKKWNEGLLNALLK